ncbi:MAG: hypothetical protein QG556_838 [Pseudomonadota bacterium]|nr:hypothetical protein [Pseudomonadota bacterium]
MNIVDAVRSGKPFRRKAFAESQEFTYFNNHAETYEFCKPDFLTDDWEIEEPKVEVTATMVREAVSKLHGHIIGDLDATTRFMLKELGL